MGNEEVYFTVSVAFLLVAFGIALLFDWLEK